MDPLPRIRETTSPAGPPAGSSLLPGMSSRRSGHCLFAAVAWPLKTYLPLVDADPEVTGSPGSRLDVESPETRQECRIETGQSTRGTVVMKPADTSLPPRGGTREAGFSRAFPSAGEFLAFARAEIENRTEAVPGDGEDSRAREVRLAADEEMLNARELRIAREEWELQQRLGDFEEQEQAHFEALEHLQLKAFQDEVRLEQGMENAAGWTRQEVELENAEALRAKDKIIDSQDRRLRRLTGDLEYERKRLRQVKQESQRIRDEREDLRRQVKSSAHTIAVQREAFARAGEDQRSALAGRGELEKQI